MSIANNLQYNCPNVAKDVHQRQWEEGSVGIMQTFVLRYQVYMQG